MVQIDGELVGFASILLVYRHQLLKTTINGERNTLFIG